MEKKKEKKRTGIGARVFWGLFFLAAATAIILGKLGVFAGVNLGSILFAALLIIILIASLVKLFWFGVFFPAAFACIIFAEPLGISSITPWPVLGAALLLSIGFSILFHKKSSYSYYGGADYGSHWKGNSENFDRVVNTKDGSEVHERTSFGSTIKYINSDNLQTAVLDCSFGAMKAYFDGAVPAGDEISLTINVSFGAMELYIPKSWRLINNLNKSLSAVEEKNPRGSETPITTVSFSGSVSFSAVSIFYV